MVTYPCKKDNADQTWTRTDLQQFQVNEMCMTHSSDPYPDQNRRTIIMFVKCHDAADQNLRWQQWKNFIDVNHNSTGVRKARSILSTRVQRKIKPQKSQSD